MQMWIQVTIMRKTSLPLLMLFVKIISSCLLPDRQQDVEIEGLLAGKIELLTAANNLIGRTMSKFRWRRIRVESFRQ